MIARAVATPNLAVDTGFGEPFREIVAEQEMIEPEPGIALPAHALVVPEGIDALLRVEMA